MDVTPSLQYVIRHRRWAAPLIWLVAVTVFTAGALSAGFDQAALPWIAGVVAVLVAGFIAGVTDVVRGRNVGWLGIAGWVVIPVLHLWANATADSWTVPFVADLIAILGAEACAGFAIAGAFFPPRPGSPWVALAGEGEGEAESARPRRGKVSSETGALRLDAGSTLLIVGLVLVSLLGACGQDGEIPAPPATTSTPATMTSTSTTTTSTFTTSTQAPTTSSAPTTSTTMLAGSLPDLLIAHDAGVDLIQAGVTTNLVVGVPVQSAVPDLRGGVVYQEMDESTWHWDWDAEQGRPAPKVEAGEGPPPISWLRAPGEEPQVLVPALGTRPWLSHVAILKGHPTVVYTNTVFVIDDPAECRPGELECVWGVLTGHLYLLDLETDEVRDLGAISSFESSVVDVRFAEEVIAVRTVMYGETDGCGAIYPRDVVDPPGALWIGEGGPLWRRCHFGPTIGCSPGECSGTFVMDLAGDGETVAYAELFVDLSNQVRVPEVVILDVRTLDELKRVAIGEPGVVPTWIEWNGRYGVVGRTDPRSTGIEQPLPVLVVDIEGGSWEIPAEWRVSLWDAGEPSSA